MSMQIHSRPTSLFSHPTSICRQAVEEKKMPNLWDNPYPEWSLETGGSMYFIPDAASCRSFHSFTVATLKHVSKTTS